MPGIFFSFAECKKELRIKTLARLSGMENREIRRGSAYLLHWYGVPKAQHTELERLPPSWDKLKKSAEEAKSWLDLIYLIECDRDIDLRRIEDQIREVESTNGTDRVMVVIDDCQRLGNIEQKLTDRIVLLVDAVAKSRGELADSHSGCLPRFTRGSQQCASDLERQSAKRRRHLGHGDRFGTDQKTHRTQSSAHSPHHKEPRRGKRQTDL